jgi:O-acetyl-ADP-ribose deacetylase (regulator of RNase III)
MGRKAVLMLLVVNSDLFRSPAQTIVNTVNTVGVMGKGIAKEFSKRYPQMFQEYKAYCDSGDLVIGALHVWRGTEKWVLNFPTKTTWRKPSKIQYIEHGLKTFCQNYARLGIRSIAFPPLGCGNGELDWNEVKPLMVQYLYALDIPIWIHEVFYRREFKPEQLDPAATRPPNTFGDFVADFRAVITHNGGRFEHWLTKRPFRAEMSDDGDLRVFVDSQLVLDEDFLAIAWVGLRLGLLTPEHFGAGFEAPGPYIMAILKELPYVQNLPFQASGKWFSRSPSGLLFNQSVSGFDTKTVTS